VQSQTLTQKLLILFASLQENCRYDETPSINAALCAMLHYVQWCIMHNGALCTMLHYVQWCIMHNDAIRIIASLHTRLSRTTPILQHTNDIGHFSSS